VTHHFPDVHPWHSDSGLWARKLKPPAQDTCKTVEMLVWLKVDPVMDALRSDVRFQELVRRMNFPP